MVQKKDCPPEKMPQRPAGKRTRDTRSGSVRETRKQEKNDARSGRKKT